MAFDTIKKYLLIGIASLFWACNSNSALEETPKKSTPKKSTDFGLDLSEFLIYKDSIKEGDTFGDILNKQNLKDKSVFQIESQIKDTFDIKNIRLGQPYFLLKKKTKTAELQYFAYQKSSTQYLIIDLSKPTAIAYHKNRPVKYKRRVFGGVLKESLAETLENAKIEGALAGRISKIYAWTIDFFKLKKGDRFGLTFTERYINDSIYDGVDSIHATFFEYKGKIIYAFPFEKIPNSGKVEFYDEEGKTLKNFFLKAPLKFSRISSRFSGNRFHPVQQVWKAHKGTDYAAPTGTPIMTTASGVVEQTGFTTGNGNFVKVKHNSTYSTQYLHMSRILVHKGQQVTQGQTIGLVGSTGLASGPHVCYRFWKNGIQVDALKLDLPTGEPMTGETKQKFIDFMKPLKRELDSVSNL